MNSNNTTLVCRRVDKWFGSLKVLDGIDITAEQNEFVALLGPSGCGKSTLFNLISGIDSSYSGIIKLHGQDIKESAATTGYMLQNDLLLPWRTVQQNIDLPRQLNKVETISKEEQQQLLHLFDLSEFAAAYPSTLSGGMRQRVNLLRTYTLATDILLLDEPFGALDALTKLTMHSWFKTIIRQKPRTVLFVTHDIEESLLLADRIYLLTVRPAAVIRQLTLPVARKNDDWRYSGEFAGLKRQIIEIMAQQ